MSKPFVSTAAAALAALGFAGSALAETRWDMPTGYPATSFHTENIERFAAEVAQATGGELKITVHPNGSLFKQNEIKRAVQTGQAQAGEILLSSYGNEDPMFSADAVPFLATSYAEAKRLWELSRPPIEAKFAKQGMRVLFAVPWLPQGIYSKQEVLTTEALKGVKWRSYSPQTSRIAQLLGAQPVTIQAAELAQALATGVVDAHITSAATGVDIKVWDSMGKGSYYYDVQAWVPKNLVFMSEKAFKALTPEQQAAVLKAAAEAEARGWKTSEDLTGKLVQTLKDNGIKVEPPSPALRGQLEAIGKVVIGEWAKSAGADGQAVVDGLSKH